MVSGSGSVPVLVFGRASLRFVFTTTDPMDPHQLAGQLGQVSLDGKSRKKRSARAFHTDFSTGPELAFPTPPTVNNSPSVLHQQTPSVSSPSTSSFAAPYGDNASPMHASHPVPAAVANPSQNDLSIQTNRYNHQKEYMTSVDLEPYKSFYTFHNVVPPTAGTQIHTVDQGTASGKFIRSTMYNVPESEQLRAATKLPMAVTIRPFAPLLETEEPIPVVDMTQLGDVPGADALDIGPVRCRRCRTYMNPAMQHTPNYRFVCNICQFPNNTVPSDYSSMINPQTGTRVDVAIRPELHKGVYDILVPKSYNVGGPEVIPQVLHHVFLIDVSEQSIRQNLPTLFADAIRLALYGEAETFNSRVCIITFDRRLQFYNLSPSLSTTQISISSDLEDPFVPLSDGLFADPEESRHVIENMLENLELLLMENNVYADPEPCFAAACRTAMLCLQSVGGGKITSLLSTLPSWGPGSLRFKDNRAVCKLLSPELEKVVFTPDNDYYKLLAKDFILLNVGLDTIVVTPSSVDLSNIGWLCSISGGSVYRFPDFNFERDSKVVSAQFVSCVNKCRGYQGQLKLRCSNGLQVSQYYGTSSDATASGFMGTQDPVLPILHEDQSFTVLMTYDGKLDTKYDCHFQAALLYTDPFGVRKVRVVNLVLAVSERLEDVFNFVEEDSVVSTIVRETVSHVGVQRLLELRESVNTKLVDVFTQYRAMCEVNRHQLGAPNQLLFPDSLKHLPIYMLSLIRTTAIRNSNTLSADARLASIYQLLRMPVERLVYTLYPALVELHSLQDDECMVPDTSSNPNHFISLPEYKPATSKILQPGVYILCNGSQVFVWVHPDANELLIKDLFGDHINSVKDIDPLMDELPDLPSHISQQARNLVRFFQKEIVGLPSLDCAGVRIVRHGIDPGVNAFRESLIEDSIGSLGNLLPLLPDYLSNLHKAIKVKLENDKSSGKVKNSVKAAEDHSTLAQKLIQF